MGFLTEYCSFHLLTREIIAKCQHFSCGNGDLDEFFAKDSPLYTERLLGKTYCYLLDEDPTVILFSTEEQEAENAHLSLPLKTRYMYYDLIDVIK